MQQVELARTGRSTSRLGFGGSGLIGGVGRRESLALLDAAYGAGIRHFDTAPMYGDGGAELCLGEFLLRRRAEVTVTSKYGILPATGPRWKAQAFAAARTVARPLARAAPGLKARVGRAAREAAPPPPRAAFTPADAAEALERSLRSLKTDHIDLWLLHEVVAEELERPGLLELMQSSRAEGKVGDFGVASEAGRVSRLERDHPEFCNVVQFEWSVTDPPAARSDAFRLHHGAFAKALPELRALLASDAALARRWSEETDRDLADAEVLAALLLKAALEVNPQSVILFFSRQRRHIEAGVAAAEDPGLRDPAMRLWELVQEEQPR